MTAIATTISEEEFARWLRPSECFELLSPQWSYEIIRSTILRHLIHEQLLGRAGTLIITGPNPKRTYRNALIPTSAWEAGNPSSHSHFWDNGLFDFSDGMGFEEREFSCFDVRFDPVVIQGLIKGGPVQSAKPLEAVAKRRQDLPLLPDPIAQAWMAWFKTQPNPTKEGAEQHGALMFPNHNLSRDRIRDLFGSALPGRPLKTGD